MKHNSPVHASVSAQQFVAPSTKRLAGVSTPRAELAQATTSSPSCACGGVCPRCTSPSLIPGPGSPLPEHLQAEFAPRLGVSLSNVRVHADTQAHTKAEELDANAYTHGQQIVFGQGRYQPETPSGRELIAHELIHVVQQSGQRAHTPQITEHDHGTESEARRGATILASGGSFHPSLSGHGLIQRDDNNTTPGPTAAPKSNYQLQLDPALMAQMRVFFAQWIATQTGTSSLTAPLAPLSTSGNPGSRFTPLTPNYSLTSPLGLSPLAGFGGASSAATSSNIFRPIPPDPTFVPPDYSSLYGPYNDRGVPLSGRDRDGPMIDQIYAQRWSLVSGLPDIRSWAPPVFRPLIPDTWRRDLASALTGLTVDSALQRDYPTPVEAADAFLLKLTGDKSVVPTYINPPFKPFKWEF